LTKPIPSDVHDMCRIGFVSSGGDSVHAPVGPHGVLQLDGELEALRMLTDRREALTRRLVQTVDRLQALLAELLPGQAKRDITTGQAKAMLATVRPRDIAGKTRRRLATEELAELVAVEAKIKKSTSELKAIVELVRILDWDRGRLSHQIRRMEARGLLTRGNCPTDARGTVIGLTEHGWTTLQQAAPGHVKAVRVNFFDVLTDADILALDDICRRVNKRIASLDLDLDLETCAEAEATL
jgi:DNA-binding MarR family transcriptional regulator